MIGTQISHYRILQKLGAGGMGVVYKARDTKLDRDVALKFLPVQLSADEEERKRFIHEAKAASALDHANICSIYEIGETPDGQLFIAMGYYEGKTLKDRIKSGPMPISETVEISIQIAEGLKNAHGKGIVHRDLKPANVMLTAEGVVKIVDFGLAKLKGLTRLTKSGTTLGTAAYMSPEQALGKEVDQRTDIWSLGVVLYEMLSGQLPFTGEYEQGIIYSIINEEPRALPLMDERAPSGLKSIIDRALVKNPELRYPSMQDLLVDLSSCHERIKNASGSKSRSFLRNLWKPAVIVPAFLILLTLGFFGLRFFKRQAKIQWAQKKLLPQISEFVEAGRENYIAAYKLACEARNYLPHHPLLNKMIKNISVNISIRTEPPGAKIFIQDFQKTDGEWECIGVSPIVNIRLPLGFFRVRMEKEGFETNISSAATFDYDLKSGKLYAPSDIVRTLDRTENIPAGMVRVMGEGEISDFFIDQYEITNKQFREFVKKGGYQKKEFWQQPFVRDGKQLTWEQAIKEFVDQTGVPGPAGWQASDYPKGEDDYPVSGINWYEADAYANYAGKSLPTSSHWQRAAGGFTTLGNNGFYSLLASQSNFSGRGPAQVGSHPGVTSCGAFDMAGNVREWCWNESPQGRIIRGGAWNDAPYMFEYLSQSSPFDRSLRNGFRCAFYLHFDEIPKPAFQMIKLAELPDMYQMKPVPDSIFQIYKEQFSYDKTRLDARLEWRKESAKDWVLEKITFNTAYENERMAAYLFLPKDSAPPYQTVIYFPGSGAMAQTTSKDLDKYWEFEDRLSFLPTNGRAVLFPIYKGTFERGDLALVSAELNSHRTVEWTIKLIKDFTRSIDYLESRPDIDNERLAYFGFSWGGGMGTIVPAVEDRLRASILAVGGLWANGLPEINHINYIKHVKIPTLMLNGKFDLVEPYEKTVKPMFDLLGTPKEQKLLKLYNTDHFIPRNEYIKEILNWLDRYLGPVKR